MNTITYEAAKLTKRFIQDNLENGKFQHEFDALLTRFPGERVVSLDRVKNTLITYLNGKSPIVRTVYSIGCFIYDIREGTLSFQMPATKDLVGMEIFEDQSERVKFTLCMSQSQATNAGCYNESVTVEVDTFRHV